jgi:DegV family protein with EDD domain
MEHITPENLKEMILLSCKNVESRKEEINKINVFPVPDQDTGNNLAKTLGGIREAIENKEFKNLGELAGAVLDGALTTAQGNAGVIYTGFLSGFLSVLGDQPADALKLASAFEKGEERAIQSIQNPKQGTILDVIGAVARTFKEEVGQEKDIMKIFKKSAENAREALLATREKMEIFRRANVVDAGGLGFLIILESYLDALGVSIGPAFSFEEKPSEKVKRFIQKLSYRYEVVCLLRGSRDQERAIREKLKGLGNCLDIVQARDKIKIHIHTDYPDDVKNILVGTGQVQDIRIEDMAKEVAGEESVRKVAIGLVVEDVADLPQKVLERYQIATVPLIMDWPEGKDLPGENVFQKMREAEKRGVNPFPKTSQAIPRSYTDAFRKQLENFEKVFCLTLTSKVSGCYNSAKQAEAYISKSSRIFVMDSLNASSGHALLALRAMELIQEQREIDDVMEEVKKLIPKTHTYIIFEDPKWVEAGGRVSKGQANWIRRMKKVGLFPITTIKDGKVVKGGIVHAKDMAEALYKRIARETDSERRKGRKIRVIISHADNPEAAENLRQLLKGIKAEVPFMSLASPVICCHTGPGTILVAWQAI